MTVLAQPTLDDLPEHLVLYDVDWAFYDQLLKQIGNRPLRVTYDNGDLEIMSPLPEHDWVKSLVGRMIETLSIELEIPIRSQGSTTYRHKAKRKGLEPDECYYIQREPKLRGKRTFDPSRLSPDLAVEVDVTHRSIPRMPIYAALEVPEVWRHDGHELFALKLVRGEYAETINSVAFPFLKVRELNQFIELADAQSEYEAIKAFQAWIRQYKR